jgi:hypothetical protein
VLDFKTNRSVPGSLDEADPAYICSWRSTEDF